MDTTSLDPRRVYLLGCQSGHWVTTPIPADGPAVRATIRAAELVESGNYAAAMETLRSAQDRRD